MKLPVLFSCDKLDGRLTEKACVRRYTAASGLRPFLHNNTNKHSTQILYNLTFSPCNGCEDGRRRASSMKEEK